MKICKQVVIAIVLSGFVFGVSAVARAADEAEVRSTVQRIFQQLKSHDYSALYDSLPASSRARVTRDGFSSALKRAQEMYVLDRMDVGQVRLANDIAVVDTVLYGKVVRPITAEGKIVVQQYLVREIGRAHV